MKFRWGIGRALSVMAMALVSALPGCDESLPPREEPKDVLDPRVIMRGGQFFAWYELSPATGHDTLIYVDQVSIVVMVRNIFNEVLQDSVNVHGFIEIWDIDRPGHRAVLDLRRASIAPALTYPGALLTIRPGQAATLGVYWNQFTTDSVPVPMWKGVPASEAMEPDPRSGLPVYYLTTVPVHLALRANVQIFFQAGRVSTPLFTCDVTYRIREAPSPVLIRPPRTPAL